MAGEQYRIDPARAYPSLEAMLAAEAQRDDGIDFVAIVTPNHNHLPSARAALAAGATMINDITGMRSPEALRAVAETDCAVCVMHMQGSPGSMQQAPSYDDVVFQVREFLSLAVDRCRQIGIDESRVVLDPGFGFGKSLDHNLALFRALTAVSCYELPLLVGISRKSMLGMITGRPVEQRQAASLAANLVAAQKGAKILRVHDVAATRDVLAVWKAIEEGAK